MSEPRGINPNHSSRIMQLERELARLRSGADIRRDVASSPRRPIVRWAKTVAENGVPYPAAGNVFPFVFVQRTFNETTGATTEIVLGDEADPLHKLYSNDYLNEGSVLPVTEIDGQWWRNDETGEGEDCKIVKLNQVIRPAWEVLDEGEYRQFTPGATANTYSRALGSGELILGSGSVQCVNLAHRSYGIDGAARAEYNLAVPIGGGQYALVPMANDPYLPMVSLEYRALASGGVILEVESEGTHKTTWIQQDLFTALSFGRVAPLDTDEGFPLFARAHRTGLYICKPGKYLIMAGVVFNCGGLETNYGSPKVLTTGGASAGTPHTHDYEADGPWGQLAMQVRANLIDAATPSLTPFYPDSFQHVHLQTFYENQSSGTLEVTTAFTIAPVPGFITRYNLMAGLKAWNFDAGGVMPSVAVKEAYIRAIPISDYLHGQAITTNNRHVKQFNPYSTGSFVWHDPFAYPPSWDKDGNVI